MSGQLLATSLDQIGHNLSSWFSLHGFNILVIVVGAWILRHFSTRVISQALRLTIRSDLYPTQADRDKRIKTLNSLVSASLRIAVFLIATIMIVAELGINTGPLLASAGVLGVALGFGAQSLIKDFVSGVFIIIENQYRVGDVVKLGDVSGVVEAITIRTTVLRDLDGHVHHVPNGTVGITTNKTMDYGRINEDIVVSFDTDVDQLTHVINHVGAELAAMPEFKDKIQMPPHLASIKGFSGNGLVVKILATTAPAEEWKIRSEMYGKLKKAFEKNGIELAGQSATAPPIKKK